ncbi:MAG: M23 family metallopeptidase [Campylobacterota bacterium]|nr:M23 family metallopeptidase [Campylobacterota bacterium]
MTFQSRRSKFPAAGFIIIVLLVAAGAGYLYLSPMFEQDKPTISSSEEIHWNLKSKLNIEIDDASGLKYYKVIFKDGEKSIVLNHEIYSDVQKNIKVEVSAPKLDMFYKGKDVFLEIEAVDNSKWNMLEGNKAVKKIKVYIDTKKPTANVLSNSRYIKRGGSAAVVVKVEDENLVDAYISFNNEKKFKLIPYYKKGYYAAIIGWPMDIEEFKKVNLIAVDKAQNKTITKIPFYIQSTNVKVDNIKLSEKFIKNVSVSVLEQSFENISGSLEEIFIYSNKDLREKNIDTIETVAQKAIEGRFVENFSIKPFRRLRGSKRVADFGERRIYTLNGKEINEAWHLGIDWASVKKATVRTSNEGEVVFKDYLGLYGNTIIIDHTLGLCSLYAHTSSQSVSVGDKVSSRQKIANTGSTGAVFGDHLHFGILAQGLEVNPIEWMDKNWIKTRITDILNNGKKIIDGK